MEAGMVVSNEPGYYEDGKFGIRIENLLIVKEAPTPYRFGGISYLGFERLTFSPIQAKMMSLEVSLKTILFFVSSLLPPYKIHLKLNVCMHWQFQLGQNLNWDKHEQRQKRKF